MRINLHSGLFMWARIALILFVVTVLLVLLHLGGMLFIPLFFAFLASLLLFPVSFFFEKLHFGKTLSAVITVVLFLMLLSGLWYFIAMQVENLLQNLPNAKMRFSEIVQDIERWISARFHIESKDQQTYLSRSVNSLLTGSIGTTFSGALRLLILFVLFIFFTFFMLVYRNLLKQSILSFFKDTEQEKALQLVNTIRYVVNNYLIGLITEMGILFVILFVSLIILGAKYALLLALLGAIMNIIPYIGIYTAALAGVIMTLVNGTESMAFDVAMIFIGAHLIDSNILMPYIVGGKVKINPFIALVALIAGDLVWGIPGMFLFIPLTAIVRIMISSVRELKPWAILIGAEE